MRISDWSSDVCSSDLTDPAGSCSGKLLSPARRRRCIDHIRMMMPVSERRLCRVLGQHRSTQRKAPRGADDEADLTEDISALARHNDRYGYRRVTALLRDAGWRWKRIAAPPIRPR